MSNRNRAPNPVKIRVRATNIQNHVELGSRPATMQLDVYPGTKTTYLVVQDETGKTIAHLELDRTSWIAGIDVLANLDCLD